MVWDSGGGNGGVKGRHPVAVSSPTTTNCGPIHALTIPHFIDNTLLLSVTTLFRYPSSLQLIE